MVGMNKTSCGLWVLLGGFLLLATACGGSGAALPTVAAAASLNGGTATVTILPATLDIAATQAAAVGTPVPTNTRAVPTPTPVDAVVNIVDPDEGDVLTLGSTIEVRGLVQKELEQAVWISLVSRNGRLLVELPAVPNEIGWEAEMYLPEAVSGAAYLQASIREPDGTLRNQYQLPVMLRPNTDTAERYLLLRRPLVAETAVSGFNIFFDGDILRPVNNTLSLSIWVDDCQRRVARENFVLGGSSRPFYWQGFVIVPRDAAGAACAVASFGEPGSPDWREAQVPIEILPTNHPDAKGIRIGNPPPNSEIIAGEEFLVYGTALNVEAGELLVSVLLENGLIVSQTPVTTDFWGYWETSLRLPTDVAGQAQIIAETGEGEDFADGITTISVILPPTPTP